MWMNSKNMWIHDILGLLKHVGILEFPQHLEFPAVYRLSVHLKDDQTVYFDPKDDIQDVANCPTSTKTQLIEWFTANQDPACIAIGAKDFTYQEFPQHMVWNKKGRKWKPHAQRQAIGRMYFVPPNAGEWFYLRTLLTVIKGMLPLLITKV